MEEILGELSARKRRTLFCRFFCSSEPPALVARPGETAEVAAAARLCNEMRVPLITSGGGGIGLVEAANAVVLDLARMNKILSVNATDFDALVEPAVSCRALDAHLAEKTPLMFTVGGWR